MTTHHALRQPEASPRDHERAAQDIRFFVLVAAVVIAVFATCVVR